MSKHPTTRRPESLRIGSCIGAVSLLALLFLSGCAVNHYHGGAPIVDSPPRVARPGYVHHSHGVQLVFEDSWRGYRVSSLPHHYFHAGRYYRWQRGRWERAPRLGGPWAVVTLRALPAGLGRREGRPEARSGRRDGRPAARAQVREARAERQTDARERRDGRRLRYRQP